MTNADANVEPGIAVDEVVASAAFECVVAVTGDQDVAARPGHHRFGVDAFGNDRADAAAKPIAHPVDSSDTGVGEFIAPHVRFNLDLLGRSVILAAPSHSVNPTGTTFGMLQSIAQTIPL